MRFRKDKNKNAKHFGLAKCRCWVAMRTLNDLMPGKKRPFQTTFVCASFYYLWPQKTLKMAMKIFTEKQRFNQWWVWLLLIVIAGFVVWGFVQQIVMNNAFGNNLAPEIVQYFALVIAIGLIVFFRVVTLYTRVDVRGVTWRFSLLHRKEKHISWKEITKAEVIKYHPIRDYGGWGYRLGSHGKAYSVAGKYALRLTLHKEKKLLIGTQKPEELKRILQQQKHAACC